MNIEYHIRGLKADEHLRNHLLAELHALTTLIPISHAEVVLERQRQSNPPFQALVLLGVPGPDIHAAARDHTWQAAWTKVTGRLRQQILDRRARQRARHEGEPCLQTAPRRPNSARSRAVPLSVGADRRAR